MKLIWPTPDELDPEATPHQRERYALATAGRVGILGGNPGAGKTTVAAWAIKALLKHRGPESIAVMAPTGKAAVRITQAMSRHSLPIVATTGHRALGVSRNGHDGKGWGFIHNEKNPLDKEVIVFDEGSMLGCGFACHLLSAIPVGCHVLFIGDFAQLPPVEHGAPLRDMISADLPYGELEEIHRNEGDIIRICRDLKEGRPYRPSRYIDTSPDVGHNALHIEAWRPATAAGALASFINRAPPGIDRVWDIQVLCAVNANSAVAREELNEMLQSLLNPNGERVDASDAKVEAPTSGFRVGDKVICGSNGCIAVLECSNTWGCKANSVHAGGEYLRHDLEFKAADSEYTCRHCGYVTKPSELRSDYIANGEIGKVVSLDRNVMHVEIDAPWRIVRVAGEWLSEFDLAYAITVHKSQGSQWKVPIIMADDSHGADMVTSWEHWRTAISRAELLSVTIGKKETIHRQCRRSALKNRKTFLVERLAEQLQQKGESNGD